MAGAVYEISSGATRARVTALGAERIAWSVDGRNLLWTPDPAIWAQTAPLLFPVCGWTRGGRVRVGETYYPLGLHGFAARKTFELVERGEDFVRLLLRDDAQTRALYPFAFELAVEYRVGAGDLTVEATVRNPGTETMPYAFGLHPGFCWPFAGGARDAYWIEFDEAERPETPVIAPGGLFSTEMRPVALDGNRLLLDDDTFAREALCFLDARSRGLRFCGPHGRLRIEGDGFRHLVLWSRPGAPFLCVESWTGYGDPVDFNGELAEKPSMILLPPGEVRVYRARTALEA